MKAPSDEVIVAATAPIFSESPIESFGTSGLPQRGAAKSVLISPGAIELTRIPSLLNSFSMDTFGIRQRKWNIVLVKGKGDPCKQNSKRT